MKNPFNQFQNKNPEPEIESIETSEKLKNLLESAEGGGRRRF